MGGSFETTELDDREFFVGVQFHPEFKSGRTNRIRFSAALSRLHLTPNINND
jgi:CTP synthase (UTP-ammonia lyase)